MSIDDTSPLADLATRRGYHHGNLRESLLEAARRLTAERGPHGFTMAEAARLAGVSASAPYRHFKDRDALLAELCRRGFALFGARLGQAGQEGGLTAMGRSYLAFAREEPGYYGAMFDWRAASPAVPGSEASFGTLVTALARMLPQGMDARSLAVQVWAMSHGVAGLERAGMLPADPPPEAVLEAGVARLLGYTARS
ncbi:TetR/AcrR family transcriptional regulator [Roseomonas sp. F4]